MLRTLLRAYWLFHIASPFPISPYVRPEFVLTTLIPLIVAGICGFVSTFRQIGVHRQRILYGVAVVMSLLTALYRYTSTVFGLMQAQGDFSVGGFLKAVDLLSKAIGRLISTQVEQGYLWSPFAVGFNEFVVPVVSLGLVIHFFGTGQHPPFASAASSRVSELGGKG
jgi:hypothetical protein